MTRTCANAADSGTRRAGSAVYLASAGLGALTVLRTALCLAIVEVFPVEVRDRAYFEGVEIGDWMS